MVSNMVILIWDFFYWFLFLSEMEEKISWPKDFCSCIVAENFSVLVQAQMHAYICTCTSVFVLPRLLLYISVLSCLHKSYLSYQGTNILCLHYTVQSVIIIVKPKQNPTKYGVFIKIRWYFCQSRASSEVLHSGMFALKKVLLCLYRDLCFVKRLALLLLSIFFK